MPNIFGNFFKNFFKHTKCARLQIADRRKGIIKSICMICEFIYVARITRWRVMAFFDNSLLGHRKKDMTIPP